jgi:energy-coupling factor transporter transmembrane protein EcfT
LSTRERFLPIVAPSPSFRLGLFALIVAACGAAGLSHALGLAALTIAALLSVAYARVPVQAVLLRLVPVVSFCVIALALALVVPVEDGRPTLQLPIVGRPVARKSAQLIAAIAAKSTLVLLFATAFATRFGERDLLVGLTGLHLPSKAVSLLYLTVRSLHVVGQEVHRLIRGRDSRGRPTGIRAIKVGAAITQLLMLRLGRRADTQAMAMVSRGFRNCIPLSEPHPVSPGEVVALVVAGAVMALVVRL